jgi:hypothetical protein
VVLGQDWHREGETTTVMVEELEQEYAGLKEKVRDLREYL